MIRVNLIRERPLKPTPRPEPAGTRAIKTIRQKLNTALNIVGETLFPNAGAFSGLQPAFPGGLNPHIFLSKAEDLTGVSAAPATEHKNPLGQYLQILHDRGLPESRLIKEALIIFASLPSARQEHNLQVAFKLAEWEVSPETFAAALLLGAKHPPASLKPILDNFHKLDSLPCKYKEKDQADYYRNLLFQLARDHEVLLLMGAEDLVHLKSHTNGRREAERAWHATRWILKYLGYKNDADELFDLALLHLDPQKHQLGVQAQEGRLGVDRTEALNKTRKLADDIKFLLNELLNPALPCRIEYRIKRPASIVRKIEEKGKALDLGGGIRIILNSNEEGDCYKVLSELHNFFKHPVWELDYKELDDYIRSPKKNGYQSIHAPFEDIHGFPLEIQIRTAAMHWKAEFGSASYYSYKKGNEALPPVFDGLGILRPLFDNKVNGMREAGVFFVYDERGILHKLVTGRSD